MTLAEIASFANVSTGTVDRVLHNRKVSPKKPGGAFRKLLMNTVISQTR